MIHLALILRWFTGLTFLTSSTEKLDDWSNTKQTLVGYEIFSARYIGVWATILVSWEAFLATLLLTGMFHQWASIFAALTNLGFAILLAYRLKTQGGNILCGCQGIFGDQKVTWWLVGRSFFLSSVAVLAATSSVAWPVDSLPAVVVAIGVAVLIWLYTTLRVSFDLALKLKNQADS
jgi:hypothetical protein